MAKVVVTKHEGRKATAAASGVGAKRVRDASGKFQTVRTLDGRSETFASDLTYVFGRNVAKVRRENKKVTGVVDRAPARS